MGHDAPRALPVNQNGRIVLNFPMNPKARVYLPTFIAFPRGFENGYFFKAIKLKNLLSDNK